MPLEEFKIIDEEEKKLDEIIDNKKIFIVVNGKNLSISILEATVIINSITMQLATMGINYVSQTSTGEHKNDISKKIGSTGGA